MPDVLTPTQRHRCMSHIRSKATKPEILVRKWLWAHGYRYRLNVKSVPGKPDIVMRRYRTAIFVNGCFWHGHEGCKQFVLPKTNTPFWQAKIDRNRERDRQNYQLLLDAGWQVIVIWACNLTKDKTEPTMQQVAVTLNRNLLALAKKMKKSPHIMGSPQEPAKRSAWGERRQELPRRLSGVVSTFVTSLPNAKVIDFRSFLTYIWRGI